MLWIMYKVILISIGFLLDLVTKESAGAAEAMMTPYDRLKDSVNNVVQNYR
jgi:hypothetical protein